MLAGAGAGSKRACYGAATLQCWQRPMEGTSDESMAGTIGIVRYIGLYLLRSCRNQRPFFDPTFPFALSSEPIVGNPIFTERAPPKLRHCRHLLRSLCDEDFELMQ